MLGKSVLGIDVGGSGIKGAQVDLKSGQLLSERYRLPTPKDAKPKGIIDVIQEIAHYFHWKGAIGIGFPAAIRDGVALTAANIHQSWLGVHIPSLVKESTGCAANVINDADAAGLGEIHFGAGKNRTGTIIMVTVGTGLGTALFSDGILYPNTELGHIEMNKMQAEHYASDKIRKDENLDWKTWAKRFNEYLKVLERLFWPNLFIIGGGVSKKQEKFFQFIDVKTEVVAAQLRNNAGIIGAAYSAMQL